MCVKQLFSFSDVVPLHLPCSLPSEGVDVPLQVRVWGGRPGVERARGGRVPAQRAGAPGDGQANTLQPAAEVRDCGREKKYVYTVHFDINSENNIYAIGTTVLVLLYCRLTCESV